MIHIDLFSGIGGFALAADRVFGNVEHVFVENDPFCKLVLQKHWPNSHIHGDIKTFTNARSKKSDRIPNRQREKILEIGQCDLLTGGFPCQPFSQAGRRGGTSDDRYLWPEMFRVIRDWKPTWVIAENVRGLLTQGGGVVFEQVCADLESEGYDVQPIVIPAVAVNAPHRRDRVWFVAHRKDDQRRAGQFGEAYTAIGTSRDHEPSGDDRLDTPDTKGTRGKQWRQASGNGPRNAKGIFRRKDWDENWLEVATRLCRVDDGLPRRLDRNPRLKALGNAIIPAVAEEIMKAIPLVDNVRLTDNVR